MPGKARPSLREKTLENVKMSKLSETDKKCIIEIFKRCEELEAEKKQTDIFLDDTLKKLREINSKL
jgi:hypothetical protein